MNIETFEQIKQKLEQVKQKRARTEGAIENIEKDWKENNISSLDEATNLLKDLETQQSELEETLETLFEELKNLTNWNAV